ncbi:MAG: flippase [Candidatus Hydrogenedentes bacterium]|nr:flippase [Candidatus Hydrogenedentota bacterium]
MAEARIAGVPNWFAPPLRGSQSGPCDGRATGGELQRNEGDTLELDTKDTVVGGVPKNVTLAVFKNAGVQVIGRVMTVASKYLAFILIFRYFGAERFGEYALILTLLSFCEAVLDFGFGDISVRELCQRPDRARRVLSVLPYAKVLQLLVAYLLLGTLLVGLRYPEQIVTAGLIAGFELFCVAGILIYRSLFKARLQMERDVLAEVVSLGVFLALLLVICERGAGLSALCGALVASRFVYFLLVYWLGRKRFDLRQSRWDSDEMRVLFAAALPVGLSAFLVSLYTSMDVLILSKFVELREVGLYAAAYRFVLPLVSLAMSLMVALYPILSHAWTHRRQDLGRYYQQGWDCAAILAGATFCGVQGGASFLMGLFGAEAVDADRILRVLDVAIATMFLSCLIGPMFVIVGRQWLTFVFGTWGVLANFTLNLLLIPRFSAMGAAWATVLTELSMTIPSTFVIQRLMGYRLHWSVTVKVGIAVAAAVLLIRETGLWGGFWGGAAAAALYGAIILMTGAIRPQQVRGFVLSLRGEA